VIGSKRIEEQLLSSVFLRQYAPLTIVERCQRIKERFNVVVARETLRKFYIRNDVRYYRSRPQLYAFTWDMAELEQRRFDYAEMLCEYIHDSNSHVL
jgi:hypothetical protein